MKKVVIEQYKIGDEGIALDLTHEGVSYFEIVGMLICALYSIVEGDKK